MTKLKELEQRLRDEPDNLGLRVMVAGALHDAGRRDDAVELYRSVAIAYRDQGRSQQAITVCRSILELAPGDAPCRELLATLLASQPAPRASPPPGVRPSPMPGGLPARPSPAPAGSRPSPMPEGLPARPSPAPLPAPAPGAAGEPVRRSSGEMTPLPFPLPYHEADPTTGTLRRLTPADLPASLREELAAYPEIAGIAAAARQISASLIAANRRAEARAEGRTEDRTEEGVAFGDDDAAAELDTGRLMRTGPRVAPSASVPTPVPPTPPPPPSPAEWPRPPTPASVARTAASPPPASAARAAASPPARPAARAAVSRSPTGRAGGPLPPPPPGRDRPPTPPPAGDDDEPTLPPPAGGVPRSTGLDDEMTEPRELPTRLRPPSIAPQTTATGPLASAFFAPLPPRNRGAVLQRFRRRMVAVGSAVIRRGEAEHGLVIVVRGRLDLHAERADGARVALGAIGPGEFIGEASLLARAPAAAQVTAGVDSELLVLDALDFYEVTGAFPTLRAELESVASRRAREHAHRLQG